MIQKWNYIGVFLALWLAFMACSRVPVTHRKQMKLLPETMLQDMSLTEYRKVISAGPLSKNSTEVNRIRNIGNKLATAIESYMRSHKAADRLKGIKWEYNLIEKNEANAWCMPGGKVAFYTGLLPLCQDEFGIATVMGHEIAHAIARHGNERMSQQILVQSGQMGLALALSSKPRETQHAFLMAYGLGAEIGFSLPYSRLHETEADQMGLIFMAMAGFDPARALDFWKRMSQAGGQKIPTFLSTHPSDETRIKNLRAFLPQAMKFYKK